MAKELVLINNIWVLRTASTSSTTTINGTVLTFNSSTYREVETGKQITTYVTTLSGAIV